MLRWAMLDEAAPLPEDPGDLKALARLLIAEVKAQATLIEKLRHQLAGARAHRHGPSGESAEQLQLALEASEVAASAIMGRLRLPEEDADEEARRPRRRPIPPHVPRMEVELSPGEDACARLAAGASDAWARTASRCPPLVRGQWRARSSSTCRGASS